LPIRRISPRHAGALNALDQELRRSACGAGSPIGEGSEGEYAAIGPLSTLAGPPRGAEIIVETVGAGAADREPGRVDAPSGPRVSRRPSCSHGATGQRSPTSRPSRRRSSASSVRSPARCSGASRDTEQMQCPIARHLDVSRRTLPAISRRDRPRREASRSGRLH